MNPSEPLAAATPMAHAIQADFRSGHLAVSLSRRAPSFCLFSVDSLGHGRLDQNPVLAAKNHVAGLELQGQTYVLDDKPVWRVTWSEKTLSLQSHHVAGAPPFTLWFDQKANHRTLLGMMKPGERKMGLLRLPHLEDGSDDFQYYENGGATDCWACYMIKALYQLGRVDGARKIFHPMLAVLYDVKALPGGVHS